MIENELRDAFPKPPEEFQKAVEHVVAEQLTKEQKRKHFLISKSVVAVLAGLLVIGTTVGAAHRSVIQKHMHIWGQTAPEEKIVQYTQADQDEQQHKENMTLEEIESGLSGLEKENLERLRDHLTNSQESETRKQTAEEIICSSWSAEPFLLVDEAYMDGSSLFFSAHTPEGCTLSPTDTMDHAYVNGVDCHAQYFEETEEPGYYVGSIDLTDNFSGNEFLKSSDELAILMRLYTKPDGDVYDTKLFSFSDKNWKSDVQTKDLSGTEVSLAEYGSVKMNKLLVSPSKIVMKMTVTLKGENVGTLLEKYGWNAENSGNDKACAITGFYVEDSSGKRYSLMYSDEGYDTVGDSMTVGVIEQKSEDVWQWDCETAITHNFDMESESIRMIPYTNQWDADGKDIPGTEKAIEEMAFVLLLK